MIPQRDFGLVLAAAGLGSRFGSGVPKQFWELEDKPLYLHGLELFLELVGEAVVVVPADWVSKVSDEIRELSLPTPIRVQEGGSTRQESVYNGLQKLDSGAEFVLVHDAARPYVSLSLIEAVVRNTRKHGACIPVVPIHETVKLVEESAVVRTIDRQALSLAQTPQGFRLEMLKRAFAKARAEGVHGTDESSLVENMGETVHAVEGETNNVKVTWPGDLRRA